MNVDLKTILPKIISLLSTAKKHMKLIFIVLALGTYVFLIYRVNSLSLAEPTEDAISEKLAEVKVPRIDQKAVDAIDQLQSRNVEIKALFEQARNNPFRD